MEPSAEKFQELIARRLIIQAEGDMKQRSPNTEKQITEKLATGENQALAAPDPDFIKIEKNLTSLGFFTPSSKRIKNEKAKTITFVRTIDGNRVEAKVTIVPAALYGLPVTADQDKYLALQKIITDLQQHEGKVSNPIGFSSTELLQLLNQGDAGKNYQEVTEWLDIMTSTTIHSEGAVYLAGKKVFAKDRFHIFDRAVSVGKEMEHGVIADKNYVWLSEWQLENINNNYLLPIDFEAYKQLQNHIAKALVPLLQIWLYASREEGSFEKRYDELCQLLAIRQYRYLSEIKRNFVPSLDELKGHGYIADWKVEKTTDKKGYKIIFYHGEKFHRDRDRRLGQRGQKTFAATASPAQEQGSALLAEMTKRGIIETAAAKLLASLPKNQPVLDQLEWGDHLISTDTSKRFRNPPGFYLYLIRSNVSVPEDFETSRKRKLWEEIRAANEQAAAEQLHLQDAYENYCKREIDRYIATDLSESEYQQMVEIKKQELGKKFKYTSSWDSETMNQVARGAARSEISKRFTFPSFDDFCERERKQEPHPVLLPDAPYAAVPNAKGTTPLAYVQSLPPQLSGDTLEDTRYLQLPAPKGA